MYHQIFLDFDGVICDSNTIKSNNIFKAAEQFVGIEAARNFCSYFTKHNGIPRERKTREFFKDDNLSERLLARYEELNENLLEAELGHGLLEFLEINKGTEFIILSGGQQPEIRAYLQKHAIESWFTKILSGPKTKEENLNDVVIQYPALFIGDSAHDYKVAMKFKIDFIFMYEFTQESNYINDFPDITIIKNFKEMLKLKL